eukprot:449983-Pelagomonas_calceolata.AAC.1
MDEVLYLINHWVFPLLFRNGILLIFPSDSLTFFHQLRKQLLYPEKHLRHIQGDVLKTISTLISNSHQHSFL